MISIYISNSLVTSMNETKSKEEIMQKILKLQKVTKEGAAGANIKGQIEALMWVIE